MVKTLSRSDLTALVPMTAPRHSGVWANVHRALFRAASPRERARFHLIATMATLAVLSVAVLVPRPFLFPLDDAYITLHNALSLLAGADRNYVGVSPLIGATSLVHLAVVTAFAAIAPPVAASCLAGALGVLAYTSGLAALAFQHGGSRRAAALIMALGLCTGFMPVHLMNGLETSLALGAVTWSLVLAGRPDLTRALPLLCGTLPFIRPELALLSVCLMLHRVYRRLRRPEDRGGRFAGIGVDVLLACAAALPWMAWSLAATGAVLPGTAGAKVAFFAEGRRPLLARATDVMRALTLSGVLPALAMLGLGGRDALLRALQTFVAVMLLVFLWRFPGGLFHNDFRYDYIVLPSGLYGLLAALARRDDPLPRAVALLWVLLALVSIGRGPGVAAEIRAQALELPAAAAWASAHLPEDAVVLVHDAGYMAYATRLCLVDAVGLKTPDAADTHRALTEPSGGRDRSRALSAIAWRHRATHAVILEDAGGFWSRIAEDLRREGWTLTLLRTADRPGAYAVYRLSPPAALLP